MSQIPTFERLVRMGVYRIRIRRSGMYQIIPFRIEFEDSPTGKVPYLKFDKIIDMQEIEKLAQEYNFPICVKNGRAFPKGKGANDFAQMYKDLVSAKPVQKSAAATTSVSPSSAQQAP